MSRQPGSRLRWTRLREQEGQITTGNAHLMRRVSEGVFVFGVRHPGNAANAGIRDGDILVKIDNEEIVTIEDAKRVHARLIEDVKKKHRVVVVALRGGLMRQLVLDFDRDYSK